MLALVALGAVLSGFMNNVGAMALLMPVAIQLSQRLSLTAGQVLMPLAFGTILGGMTTLIGTPPNLIVSGFRTESSFSMFDFTAVGLPLALAGVLLVSLLGRFLVPVRKQQNGEGFESGAYITEVRVHEKSKAAGKSIAQIEAALGDIDAQITGLVRKNIRLIASNPQRRIRVDDILLIEAEAAALTELLSVMNLTLEEAVELNTEESAEQAAPATEDDNDSQNSSDSNAEVTLGELVVLPGSSLSGRSASDIMLRTRYGLNLLALSRQGQRSVKRLRKVAIRSGDLLLLQGPADAIAEFAADNNCVSANCVCPTTKKPGRPA